MIVTTILSAMRQWVLSVSLLIASIAIALMALFVPQISHAQTTTVLTAPTILSPHFNVVTQEKPVFTGLTYNDTKVDIYIDGVYNGRAKVKNDPSGVASWSYTAFLPLELGEHTVYAVARSQDEILRSPESMHVSFTIEEPFPSPTLLDLVIDERTTYEQPWLIGVAKNDSIIDVYIDGQLDGTIQIANHESGSNSFEYKPKKKLAPGWHSIVTNATNNFGKLSNPSNTLVFELRSDINTESQLALTPPTVTPLPTNIPAPTLYEPQSGTIVTQTKPLITGVAQNQQNVEVFINGVLNGEISSLTDPSGVYNFTYTPFLHLTPGLHLVNARATSQQGEKSAHSNTLSFLVRPRDTHIIVSPDGITKETLVKTPGTVASTTDTNTQENTGSQTEPDQTVEENTENNQNEETPSETEGTQEDSQPDNTSEESDQVSDNSQDNTEEPPLVVVDQNTEATGDDSVIVVEDNTSTTDDTNDPNNEAVPNSGDDNSQNPDEQRTDDITVVDNRANQSATNTAQAGSQNTILIVILAIAAIVIIGLISWYTSREHIDGQTPDDNATASETTPPHAETPSDESSDSEINDEDTPVWEEETVEVSRPRYEEEPIDDDVPPPPPPPALGI